MAKELSQRDWLQEKVKDLEFSLFGGGDITEIREKFYLEEKIFSLFDKAISLGKRLLDPILDDIENQPTKLYFHHFSLTLRTFCRNLSLCEIAIIGY
jgi:hypothetical protein